MNLAEAAGQTLVVGFQGQETLPQTLSKALRQGHVGGAILFRRNLIEGPEGLHALAHLNASIDACRPPSGLPPLIALDQEGGRVQRVRDGVTRIPPMYHVGLLGDRELAAQVGEIIAGEIAALGFNLNFAPVLDLWTHPENDVIGDRAFGSTVDIVAEMAGGITVGHYVAGVIPCGKHFPGDGDTVADSHFELPVIMHEPGTLERRELLPFARAISAGIPMLMTAHILIPALDALHPMTLSHRGIQQLLRGEMGFDGVVVTDDLEMKAVADRYSVEEMVELGLAAGVDLFLICHTEEKWQRAHRHLVKLGEQSPTMRARLQESAGRVQRLKEKYLPVSAYEKPEDLLAQLGTPAAQAVIDVVRRAAEQHRA